MIIRRRTSIWTPHVQPPAPDPSYPDSGYIAQHLGDALTGAMVELTLYQPLDPIEHLAMYLYRYADKAEYMEKVRAANRAICI